MRFNLVCCRSFWDSAKDVIKHFPNAKSDIYDLLTNLSARPGSGDPVPGYVGKIFKGRWALKSYKIGAQGGLRVYYLFSGAAIGPFFYLYQKAIC